MLLLPSLSCCSRLYGIFWFLQGCAVGSYSLLGVVSCIHSPYKMALWDVICCGFFFNWIKNRFFTLTAHAEFLSEVCELPLHSLLLLLKTSASFDGLQQSADWGHLFFAEDSGQPASSASPLAPGSHHHVLPNGALPFAADATCCSMAVAPATDTDLSEPHTPFIFSWLGNRGMTYLFLPLVKHRQTWF